MAQTIKILSQTALAAATNTNLYTVPAATSTVVSSVVVCNRGGDATTFRLWVAQGGAATDDKMYVYYDTSIAGNDTFVATIGITLAATDVVRGRAGNANLSISLFGVENT